MSVNVHSNYPDGYHVLVFLANALKAKGATVKFDDPHLRNCEGLVVNGVPVVWLLDNRIPANHWQNDVAREMLLSGDVLVCHCQKSDAERVGGRWLPIATTPRFAPVSREKVADFGFVGYLHDPSRARIIQSLGRTFHGQIASGIFYEDAAQVYQSSHIGVNVTALYGSPWATDINMRTFEIMACGVPLITPYNPALYELGIRDGVNCLTYRDEIELFTMVQTLLADAHLGQALARNALTLIQHRHQYSHRADQLLDWITQWQT